MGAGAVPDGFSIRGGPDATNRARWLTVNADGSINVSSSGIQALTTVTPNRVNVTDAATSLIAINANRKNCIIQNIGSNPVAIGFNGGVTFVNSGIILPQYGFFELRNDGTVITLAVYGICDAGQSSGVGVTEIE